ncbi:hypothetical protein [Streptomyces sp. HGB0020]|uniref:hypothetical protein n=1 Tax=Streptomyces sp. HGB0020 TaxID=1078086 RepID=UPI00034E68E9|nr:hypothetical protein [Streptomyces sp. HGB0020]EPD63174.1 hypothetical protein HMPREF1211_03515 [Streptomyces sp. HGB0020]
MADLATTQDLVDRLGRPLTVDEATRAPALLKDASAKVRNHTGQIFTAVAGDVIVLRPVGVLLRLPQRPVTAVTSIAAVAPDGVATAAMSGWSWDGRDKVDLTYATWSADFTAPAWRDRMAPDTYQVTYDHGDATAPEIVVTTVCAMVLRTLLSPSMTPGMAGERIGAYSYQLQQGASSVGASVVMTQEDKDDLRRYGPRHTGTIAVEAG